MFQLNAAQAWACRHSSAHPGQLHPIPSERLITPRIREPYDYTRDDGTIRYNTRKPSGREVLFVALFEDGALGCRCSSPQLSSPVHSVSRHSAPKESIGTNVRYTFSMLEGTITTPPQIYKYRLSEVVLPSPWSWGEVRAAPDRAKMK